MLIFLGFLFLLTPFPTLQASVGERKNSTKTAPHTITTLLNVKPKTPTLSSASKISNVSQTLFSTTMSPETPSVKKTSKDKPPPSSPIKVVISEGCIQKESQKDTVNSSKVQETELSLKLGSPLVMTHHISLVPGSCTGGCEAEMAALKDRVEILEKDMAALRKKCTVCSGIECPNNCNNKGKCVNGKCMCLAGFSGSDCSKGATKDNKVSSVSSILKQVTSSQEQSKANNTIIHRKDKEEKHQDQPRGPASAEKIPLKDLPLNQNVTQSTEKKSNGTLTVLIKPPKGMKESVNVTEKRKLSFSNVTSTEITKKPSQDSVTKDLKRGASVIQKLEKQVNATEEFKVKDKKQHKGHEKKVLEKHLNATSTEKDKKPIKESVTLLKEGSSEKKMDGKHSNVTTSTGKDIKTSKDGGILLKEGSTKKKLVEKHSEVTSSIEKDKKTSQGNVTQPKEGSAEKKMDGKHSNVTTSTGKDIKTSKDGGILLKEGSTKKKLVEKHSEVTSSIEKDKKTSQGNVTQPKEGSAEKKIDGKHSNVTTSTGKDIKTSKDGGILLKEGSTKKKLVEKHSEVTSSIEKDKKTSQGNVTQPKEGSAEKKRVEKLSNVTTSTEKDRKLPQSNNLPKDGSSGKRKVDKLLNVTVAINKDKKLLEDDEITANQKASSGNKKGETHVNETVSTDKDRKLNQVIVTPVKEASLGKSKVDKHLNVTNSTEKDRKNQNKVTTVKEKTSGMRNVTTSSEKKKTLVPGNETKVLTLGKKTAQKQVNITMSTGKDSKLHQGKVTLLKIEASGRTKLDSHLSVTTSIEKDKKFLQSNETKALNDVTAEKKRVEKLNVTTLTGKDKKLYKSNSTLIKEGPSHKGKADSVNVKKSTEKGKKFLQGDETAVLTKVLSVTEEKDVNATTTSEKDKSLHHSLKEDTSQKNKVNSDLTNITISKTQVERTSKLTDIGPVEFHNITATGFVITWEAPQGLFRNFTVTRREVWSGRSSEDDAEEAEKRHDIKADELHSSNRTSSKVHAGNAERKSAEKFSQILAGSARSYHFKNLRPQTKYSVSLFSSGPHVRSKVHRLFVSTGPEPPSELLFSNITETSVTVSWTKPKSTVTGFKVTYTNSANAVTGSMSVDSQLSHVLISKLSVGSRYEISVRSVIGAIESDATTASVVTVPDSPTDLQAINITDSKALLVWKPAQAKVDHYILSYGSTRSPNVTVTVMLSGTSVEHQLRGLHRSTLYAVKIMSQLNSLQSSSVSTTFTTKSGVKLQIVTPSEVTWNSALITWKTTHLSFRSYRLTYQFGEKVKEVILNPTVSQYKLTDLVASSHYTVKVDGESEGQYINVVSTAFTTTQLPYPYPAECSQVQMNGMTKSGEAEIYPEGKDGEAVWVYCDMETDRGGWTVFQRRTDGFTDFFRDWQDYSKGFGEMSAEFWLGNDILHSLTSMEPMSLRIDLRLGNDTAYAYYSNFSVGSEVNHYTIDLSGYSGTAGDSMKYHNGCPFSTKDKGPSTNSVQCAKNYMGGWWYKNCYKANLNGVYATFSNDQGVVWIDWQGKDISLPFTEMKLRPASLSDVTPNTQG